MRTDRRDHEEQVDPPAREAALERVLAILDRVPDGVTVRDLIARIEWEADKETILLLRRAVA